MATRDSYEPPEQGKIDKAAGLAQAIVGEVPGGSIAGEICTWFMSTPYQKRLTEWQQRVGQALNRLEQRFGLDLRVLQEDSAFVDIVMQASSVAVRNSQQEKRDALYNAIMNSALPASPEDSERQSFIQLVDRFTVWHLRLLHLFRDPREWFAAHIIPMPQEEFGDIGLVIERAFPNLVEEEGFYGQVWRELAASGLVPEDALHLALATSGAMLPRLLPRGESFLSFVSSPAEGG